MTPADRFARVANAFEREHLRHLAELRARLGGMRAVEAERAVGPYPRADVVAVDTYGMTAAKEMADRIAAQPLGWPRNRAERRAGLRRRR